MQVEELERSVVGKGKGLQVRCALFAVCWPGEAGGELTSSVLCDWSGVHIWLSLIGPKVETGTKLGSCQL